MTAVVLFAAMLQPNVQAANSYLGLQKGLIYGAYVDYKDSDTVTVTCGYGECNGHYWEIVEQPLDHDMTSLTTAEDFHYIYIDDANSVYSDPIIVDSTTEPAWSNSKLGWYHGNDRCIGVVWSPEGSATITEYVITPDLKWLYKNSGEHIKTVLSGGNPDGTEKFLECSAYSPVNSKAILVIASNNETGDSVFVMVRAADAHASKMYASTYGYTAAVQAWLDLPRGGSRNLYWYGYDDDNNNFTVNINGFQIER